MHGQAKAVVELLETWGGPMEQARSDYPVCANQESREAGKATDGEVQNRAKGPAPTMKAYKSGQFIGGMGGDMAFPFKTMRFAAVEGGSTGEFTSDRAPVEGPGAASKGKKKTIESDAADNPLTRY